MINLLVELLGNILLSCALVYAWNKIYNVNASFKILKDRNNVLAVIFVTLGFIIAVSFLEQPLRLILINGWLLLINYFLIYRRLKKAVVSTFISQVLVNILEFTFVIIASFVFKDSIYKFLGSAIGNFSANIFVSFFIFILLKTRVITAVYNFIKDIKNKSFIISFIMIVFIMIFTTTESYVNLPMPIVLSVNTALSFVFVFFIFKIAKKEKEYDVINKKYQMSINSLKEYELLIDKYRVDTHENKNELLTVRNMIKDKKTIQYIDKLVDNKIKDSEKIINQASKIPEGGLRATIYSKLCLMDKYKINYVLDVSKDVRTSSLIDLDDELVLNICKILGVFLDNSIEAVKKLKTKNITIELYIVNKKLFIDITNNYNGKIDLSKIGRERVTTKGTNHGYGLLLVNKIIKENFKFLDNEKSINGNNITQSLIIKL